MKNETLALAATLAATGASPAEVNEVLSSFNAKTATPKPKAKASAPTRSLPAPKAKRSNGRGDISAAINSYVEAHSAAFTNSDLVKVALKAGSKNPTAAQQSVSVVLKELLEAGTATRTGRGTYSAK